MLSRRTGNTSSWTEAINVATFEIESWHPRRGTWSNDWQRCRVARRGSSRNPLRVSRSAASDTEQRGRERDISTTWQYHRPRCRYRHPGEETVTGQRTGKLKKILHPFHFSSLETSILFLFFFLQAALTARVKRPLGQLTVFPTVSYIFLKATCSRSRSPNRSFNISALENSKYSWRSLIFLDQILLQWHLPAHTYGRGDSP